MQSNQNTNLPAPHEASPLPALLLAGLAGQAAFEIVAFVLMPAFIGKPLMPVVLVEELARTLFGLEAGRLAGWSIHLAAGIIIFPLGYLNFLRITGLSWLVAGALWGVVLWLFAQAVLAPLAGRPFMLGFVSYTWASLAAHLVYTLAVAAAFSRLSRR